MVDPNLVGCLDTNSVASRGQDLGNFDIADNDIADIDHTKADTVEHWRQTLVSSRILTSEREAHQHSSQERRCWIRL